MAGRRPLCYTCREMAGTSVRTRKIFSILPVVVLVVIASLAIPSCGGGARSEELRRSLEERISSVLTLHTAEFVYRDVVYFGEQSQLFGFIPSGSREILFSVNVAVRAGVDLRNGFSVEVIAPRKVRVILPSAAILYSDVDEDTIHQYFLRQTGREISFIEVQDVIARAKEDLVADALRRGILAQADRQAERIVRTLLEDLGMETEIVRMSGGGQS
jgi:hypothetical protein